jgi:hypothetical protein
MHLLLTLSILIGSLFAEDYLYVPLPVELQQAEIVWEERSLEPFEELRITWNGARPKVGHYTFFVSVCQNRFWSPWLYYGEWLAPGQVMFKDSANTVLTNEGVIWPRGGKCEGFRVKMSASAGATLDQTVHLAAHTITRPKLPPEPPAGRLPFVLLNPFPRQSQITLRHFRYNDLSLPVCLTLVINYLSPELQLHPLDFADRVIDDETGCYENWSLNIAEASSCLHGKWTVQMVYFENFAALHAHLMQGIPVIASVSGFLMGGPRPFRTEHALCIIGYDPDLHRIHCIDPAFPNDRATYTTYDLIDFLTAWARHRNKAIILENLH